MFYLIYNTITKTYREDAERFSRPDDCVTLEAGERWVGPLAEGDK